MFKYVISDTIDPYKNFAIEQELSSVVNEENAILFLWQNDNTIVIGKNQDIFIECKVDEFLSNGGNLARRKSGGGAVFHDLGNLNFSIICLESMYENNAYQNIVMRALKSFNVDVEFNGRNDLTVCGKKFSGNAAYTNGKVLCQHGTILICSNIEKMTYFLTPEKGKLDRNHVKSVASRVVNLNSISKKITIESMRRAMIETVDASPLMWQPDVRRIQELMLFYADSNWIYGGCL